jgi:hypothetical protein
MAIVHQTEYSAFLRETRFEKEGDLLKRERERETVRDTQRERERERERARERQKVRAKRDSGQGESTERESREREGTERPCMESRTGSKARWIAAFSKSAARGKLPQWESVSFFSSSLLLSA